ncbi:MAG: sigma-70 family RNA polymerase sigma factor [Pirellulales bacterium]|nr:sigma-70 family RNA polymerase sigma factor [Pirellulales bacterium]
MEWRQTGVMHAETPNWESLYDEHAPSLLRWLGSKVGRDQAEDCLQEIWLKAVEKGFPGGHFRGWIFTLARNFVIDRSRSAAYKLSRMTTPGSHPGEDGKPWEPPDQSESSEDSSDLLELLSRLRGCLEKLDTDKAAVVRGWLNDLPYKQLALELQMEASQISKRFDTAKNQLRRCLREETP